MRVTQPPWVCSLLCKMKKKPPSLKGGPQECHLVCPLDENVWVKCKLGSLVKNFIYSEIKSVKIFVVLEMIVITDGRDSLGP